MSQDLDQQLRSHRVAWRAALLIVVVLPGILAFLAGLAFSFGGDVDPLFFEAMATGVLPVLFVACIVQLSVLFSQMMRSASLTPADLKVVRYRHSRVTSLYGLVFLAGEAVTLYAIAAREQSTFLLLGCLFYGLVLLVMLLLEVIALSQPESFLPAEERKAHSQRLQAFADRHEELALKAREAALGATQPEDQGPKSGNGD